MHSAARSRGIAAALRDGDAERLGADSSCVRAAGAAAGAKENGTAAAASRPGRSRRSHGGFGTKTHAAVTPPGHPVALEATGSEASDGPRLPGLIGGVRTGAVLADRGYDSDADRGAVRAAGAEPCIPPRRDRVMAIGSDRHLQREREVAERHFALIKQCRRVATRYDERAANYLGFVWLASIDIMLTSLPS